MEAFARVLEAIGTADSAVEKVAGLSDYLRQVPASDACHAVRLLAARGSPRLVRLAVLRLWAAKAAGLPLWLVDECRQVAGDLGETLALVISPSSAPRAAASSAVEISAGLSMRQPREADDGAQGAGISLCRLVEERLLPLGRVDAATQRELVIKTWAELDARERVVWNRLITGTFRIGVSRALLARALAGVAGIDPMIAEYRLMGDWPLSAEGFRRLVSSEATGDEPTRPYPFHPISQFEGPASALGDPRDWQIEWNWADLRLQLIRRAGRTILWSHQAGILTDTFPELARTASLLPDGTVLDGVLATRDDADGPARSSAPRFRIQREAARWRASETSTTFIARDLIESRGVDWRARPLSKRRAELEGVVRAVETAWLDARAQARRGSFEQGELFDALAICSGPPTCRGPRQVRPEAEGGASAARLTAQQPDPEQANATASIRHSHFPAPPSCPVRLSPLLLLEHWEALAMFRESARALGVCGLLFRRRDSAYGGRRQEDTWQALGLSESFRSCVAEG